MNPYKNHTLDELLSMPLNEKGFERILEMFEQEQRTNMGSHRETTHSLKPSDTMRSLGWFQWRQSEREKSRDSSMVHTTLRETRPWEKPFWRPARGKAGVLLYLVLIHVLAMIGLILFPLPSLPVLGASFLLAALGGLGTTVGYHRLLAHRTLKVNKAIEHLLVFWAVFNGSGNPASWVAYHRHHHSRTDTPDDISSPKHGGFWWAHLRWLYQSAEADRQKWCPELNQGAYRFWRLAEAPLALLSLSCGFVFGWMGFFWIGAIRLVYSLHMQCFVNSITHLGHSEEGDSSKNVWWLGPLQLTAWGENWHRNHHSVVGSARIGWHWWQVDIGWYVIRMLEALGLASNVKRPRTQ